MAHLLVTNDFPPKVGGIQSYLYELWRRLPSERVTVLTTPYEGSDEFDKSQEFTIIRSKERVLLPRPGLVHAVNDLAARVKAKIVVLDPALPLGLIGPHLDVPYAVILHGAETTVPSRLPLSKTVIRRVLKHSSHMIASGMYCANEARRACGKSAPPATFLPPGVDIGRFTVADSEGKAKAKAHFGMSDSMPTIVGFSRLVPRKGFDTLICAVGLLQKEGTEVQLIIGGKGRDAARLRRIANREGVETNFVGRLSESEVPLLYSAADVFAMLCRNRWAGLEQEGFGIVFLEAAACGVPQIAGLSGGASEAVQDGETGFVIDDPKNASRLADCIRSLVTDPVRTTQLGQAARRRTEESFSYDALALRLDSLLLSLED